MMPPIPRNTKSTDVSDLCRSRLPATVALHASMLLVLKARERILSNAWARDALSNTMLARMCSLAVRVVSRMRCSLYKIYLPSFVDIP